MSPIFGITVGTPLKPASIIDKANAVKTVNGVYPDENGNVEIAGGSGENVDLTGYATEDWVQQGYQSKGDYALKSEIPTVPVKSVNGKTGDVSLGASDVGALPSTTKIPSKTSDLTNDSGFITGYTETDPTVPAWAKASSKPSYSKNEVGLGNVDNVKQYSVSNPPPYPVTSVNGKTGAVTLDAKAVGAQPAGNYLTEVPEGYATEEFVTNKIAEAELSGGEVDLSGYAQKSEVPTKVSQLQNDSGYLTEHQDISGKLDADKLPEAITEALTQAKTSGEFNGKSAYEIAKDHGFEGSEAEWLESLKGEGSSGNDGVGIVDIIIQEAI